MLRSVKTANPENKNVGMLPGLKVVAQLKLKKFRVANFELDICALASVQGAPQIFGNWRQTAFTLRRPIACRIAEPLNLVMVKVYVTNVYSVHLSPKCTVSCNVSLTSLSYLDLILIVVAMLMALLNMTVLTVWLGLPVGARF